MLIFLTFCLALNLALARIALIMTVQFNFLVIWLHPSQYKLQPPTPTLHCNSCNKKMTTIDWPTGPVYPIVIASAGNLKTYMKCFKSLWVDLLWVDIVISIFGLWTYIVDRVSFNLFLPKSQHCKICELIRRNTILLFQACMHETCHTCFLFGERSWENNVHLKVLKWKLQAKALACAHFFLSITYKWSSIIKACQEKWYAYIFCFDWYLSCRVCVRQKFFMFWKKWYTEEWLEYVYFFKCNLRSLC